VTTRGGPADTGSADVSGPAGQAAEPASPDDQERGSTEPPAQGSGPGRTLGAGIGRAALLIGGLTIFARILGFGRTVVFAGTVKTSCLSAAYVTANLVPNVIYDIVLGGALTAIVVPVLARPAERSAARSAASGQHAQSEVSSISSALLTWTIVILAPVSLALAVAAGPVISLLMPANPTSGCSRASLLPIASGMLAVFAPQILLYGLAVVLYGILQAHRRFTAPALAPILSSVVVIGAYVLFVPLGRKYTTNVAGLPLAAQLTLSVGTTLGVAALAVTAMVPAWRLRLRLRPTLRFPEGIAKRTTSLAAVGIAVLVAQNASVLVVIRLANAHGASDGGTVTVYNYGWQVFVSVYAVLAIPVAISAFPVLSARSGAAFDEAAASSTRATALASWLGAALLAAVAIPGARAFPYLDAGVERQFWLALVAFAPGLVGYGLMACLSRVLLADGRTRMAAFTMVAGWLVVIAVDLVVVPLVKPALVVPVLGLANTAGMTASGVALLVAVGRARGAAALRGVWRTLGAGLAGAVAGAGVGLGMTAALPVSGHWRNAGLALLVAVCALIAFGVVVALLDGGELRSVATRVRRRIQSP
jgi:peptidoglycan biosynthesis protein MviN/MurJ (putative lipid II flippase)